MARDVDERKTRAALRKLRAAKARADAGTGPSLSTWEEEFLQSLEERLTTYGSAFNDPEKGDRSEALSALQSLKVREIDRKTRGKDQKSGDARGGFSRGNGLSRRKRKETTADASDDRAEGDAIAAPRAAPTLASTPVRPPLTPLKPPSTPLPSPPKSPSATTARQRRAAFRVIDGGPHETKGD